MNDRETGQGKERKGTEHDAGARDFRYLFLLFLTLLMNSYTATEAGLRVRTTRTPKPPTTRYFCLQRALSCCGLSGKAWIHFVGYIYNY
jgi:hypothetical protein